MDAKCGPFHLLADSAYPLSRHLITPYKDRGQLGRLEINFNNHHSRTRILIEHTFGLLKQKWGQLYHVKLQDIERVCHFIRACCVLHNLALDEEIPIEDQPNEHINPNQDIIDDADDEDINGVEYRNQLARTLFAP